MSQKTLKDPNAPLIAFQRRLDALERMDLDLGRATVTSSGHSEVANTVEYYSEPCPTLDELDGEAD